MMILTSSKATENPVQIQSTIPKFKKHRNHGAYFEKESSDKLKQASHESLL